jgi:hypothetical protein
MAEQAATLQHRVTPLDPADPATWINIPCPDDLTKIQAELTRIGGLNRFERPNFIIVWAQEYRTFDLGQNRIHFDEDLIDAIHRPVRWAVRSDVYQRAQSWFQKQAQKRVDDFMNLRWSEFAALPPNVSDYLKNNELAENYFLLPDDSESLGRIARLIPEGWQYIHGHHKHEHIGQQAYYVLQWYPPESFNEKEWRELRFDKVYCPETDQDEYIDINGPFPSEGHYEQVVFRVCTRDVIQVKHPNIIGQTIEREICRYLEPTPDYCADRLREMIQIRDSLTDEQKDPTARSRKRMKHYAEELPTKLAAWRQGFRDRFNDAKPVGGGNPTNISSHKAKFDN